MEPIVLRSGVVTNWKKPAPIPRGCEPFLIFGAGKGKEQRAKIRSGCFLRRLFFPTFFYHKKKVEVYLQYQKVPISRPFRAYSTGAYYHRFHRRLFKLSHSVAEKWIQTGQSGQELPVCIICQRILCNAIW